MLAGAPVLLAQADYSLAAEREADAESVRVRRAAFATHPADAKRVAYFEQAARSSGR